MIAKYTVIFEWDQKDLKGRTLAKISLWNRESVIKVGYYLFLELLNYVLHEKEIVKF